MDKNDKTNRGSIAVGILEECWKLLQRRHEDLPAVVFALVDFQKRAIRRGYFWPTHWIARGPTNRSEIAISPELFKTAKEVLSTLLHEAVHAIMWARNIPSVDGRYYHLKAFRDTCQSEFSLNCTFRHTRYGWCDTTLAKEATTNYREVLNLLDKMPSGTGIYRGKMPPDKKPPNPGYIACKCKCEIPRIIRCTPLTFQKGKIICGVCKSPFDE